MNLRPDPKDLYNGEPIIFLDTEFTSLAEPYLISIGLVYGESSFYAELRGITPAICSRFVRKSVFPLLSGPVFSPLEMAKGLGKFLQQVPNPAILLCEDPRYDFGLVLPFLPASRQWTVRVPRFESPHRQDLFDEIKSAQFEQGLRRHHALDDARALSVAWRSVQILN